MRAFATLFVALQEARHLADYDPLLDFSASDTEKFIRDAELAIGAFDRPEADEQADVLALMLAGPRG